MLLQPLRQARVNPGELIGSRPLAHGSDSHGDDVTHVYGEAIHSLDHLKLARRIEELQPDIPTVRAEATKRTWDGIDRLQFHLILHSRREHFFDLKRVCGRIIDRSIARRLAQIS